MDVKQRLQTHIKFLMNTRDFQFGWSTSGEKIPAQYFLNTESFFLIFN